MSDYTNDDLFDLAERISSELKRPLTEDDYQYFSNKVPDFGKKLDALSDLNAIISEYNKQHDEALSILYKSTKEATRKRNSFLKKIISGEIDYTKFCDPKAWRPRPIDEALQEAAELPRKTDDDKEEIMLLLYDVFTQVELVNMYEDYIKQLPAFTGTTRPALPKIKTHGIMNAKENTELLLMAPGFIQEENGQYRLDLTSETKFPVYMALSWDDNQNTKPSRRINAFDYAVLDVMASFWHHAKLRGIEQPIITAREIWLAMNGKSSKDERPSQKSLAKIERSIAKLILTRMEFNLSALIEGRNLSIDDERVKECILEDYMLNAAGLKFITEKNREVYGYKLRDEPVLYTYNRIKETLIFVDACLLDTSDKVRDDEFVTEFKMYLLRQIKMIKTGFRNSNVILLDTLYRDTAIDPPEERIEKRSDEKERDPEKKNYTSKQSKAVNVSKAKKSDLKKLDGLLDSWKSKKYIKGYYHLNKDRKRVRGRERVVGYEIITG